MRHETSDGDNGPHMHTPEASEKGTNDEEGYGIKENADDNENKMSGDDNGHASPHGYLKNMCNDGNHTVYGAAADGSHHEDYPCGSVYTE